MININDFAPESNNYMGQKYRSKRRKGKRHFSVVNLTKHIQDEVYDEV